MAKKMSGDQILTECVENAEVIGDVLNSMHSLVPEDKQEEFQKLCEHLEKRIFYQDYLYVNYVIDSKRGIDLLSFEEFEKHYDDLVTC